MTDRHLIESSHYPHFRTKQAASATCDCGVTVSALPDLTLQDPHEPLRLLFAAHRASVNLHSDGHPRGGDFSWHGLSISGTKGTRG